MENANSSLKEFNKIIQNLLKDIKIDKNNPALEDFLWEYFVKIFKGEIKHEIKESGKYFDHNELKNAMLQICQMYQQSNQNQTIYNSNLNSQISSFEEAAYLVVNNTNNITLLSQALDSNPTLSGAILGKLINDSLSIGAKDTNIEVPLDNLKMKLDNILNCLNVNDTQKTVILLKKITENEVGYIQNVNHNIVDSLNQLSNIDLNIIILLNSLNLSIYSLQIPGIDEKERLLYSGNNNLSTVEVQNVINKNNEILANLYSANEKYGVDGLKQFINNMELGNTQFLCQLYINANSSPEKQAFMDKVDKIQLNPQIAQLKLQLKSYELHNKMHEENQGKSY